MFQMADVYQVHLAWRGFELTTLVVEGIYDHDDLFCNRTVIVGNLIHLCIFHNNITSLRFSYLTDRTDYEIYDLTGRYSIYYIDNYP
jgi:hypothetical protein